MRIIGHEVLRDATEFRKIFRFLAVGGFVCWLDLLLVWILNWWIAPALAVSVAYLTAVAVHFCLNKWWVFENSATQFRSQLLRYGLTVGACWLCTLLFFTLFLNQVTGNVLLAKAMAIPPTALLGFLLMKRFVFRSAPEMKTEPANL